MQLTDDAWKPSIISKADLFTQIPLMHTNGVAMLATCEAVKQTKLGNASIPSIPFSRILPNVVIQTLS